jgi:hypothetical protein
MKQSLRLALPATIASALIIVSTPAKANLLAQFSLEEGAVNPTTNTTWSVDGAFSGTLSGVTPPTWITSGLAPSLVAQSGTVAALTNGAIGGYVLTTFWGTNASGTSSVLGTNPRTVTAWVRTPAVPTGTSAGYIVTYGNDSAVMGGRFTLRLDSTAGSTLGKIRLEVSSGSVVGTNTVICDNNWHHLAVVCQANCRMSNVLFYVDGNLQQNTTTTPTVLINTTPNVKPLQMFQWNANGNNSTFLGAIDDVRIYDTNLTSSDILNLVYGPGNPPGITQQPPPQSVYLGSTNGSATFTVGVSGSPTLLYTWKKNGVAIAGATNQSFTISPVASTDLANYSVSITNNYGGTNSASAALAWSTPAVDPSEQTVLVGSNASFSIAMPGDSTGYTYQWLKGSSPISGTTNTSFTLSGAGLGDAANYSVAVTLSGQSATSAPVALHVLSSPASVYSQFVLRDGPSAYWRLGEANGATVAVDQTGFHNGSYSNYLGTQLQQPGALAGDANTASSFTGGNWIEVPASAALQHNNAFTLEAWVNASNTIGRQSIICSRNQFFSSGYELAVNGSSFEFRTGSSTSPAAEVWTDLDGGTVTPGSWQHVVATFDGSTKSLYVNGAVVSTQPATVLATPVPLRIGAGETYNAIPANYFFTGTIDEPAVYWSALSASQVLDHYNAGTNNVSTPGNNAYLTSLVIAPAGALNPAFTTNNFSYSATNAYVNNPVTVTATAADPGATMQLSFNSGASVGLASGTASAPQTLVLPNNTVSVTVTASDKATMQTYNVNLTLQPSLTQAKLTNTMNGSTLTLSWPADHLGWHLQMQTNTLGAGLTTTGWVVVPGSDQLTSTNISITKTNPTVFYRMTYP